MVSTLGQATHTQRTYHNWGPSLPRAVSPLSELLSTLAAHSTGCLYGVDIPEHTVPYLKVIYGDVVRTLRALVSCLAVQLAEPLKTPHTALRVGTDGQLPGRCLLPACYLPACLPCLDGPQRTGVPTPTGFLYLLLLLTLRCYKRPTHPSLQSPPSSKYPNHASLASSGSEPCPSPRPSPTGHCSSSSHACLASLFFCRPPSRTRPRLDTFATDPSRLRHTHASQRVGRPADAVRSRIQRPRPSRPIALNLDLGAPQATLVLSTAPGPHPARPRRPRALPPPPPLLPPRACGMNWGLAQWKLRRRRSSC